jgi:excinuclease ABC subunit C
VNEKLKKKLDSLPKTPGVYLHKDAKGEIIYIGKAANLRNRVRQYFQKSRARDPKTDLLIAEIADTQWTELETEADALFLEAELVRRYLPRYNILLRDDKSQIYVRISYKSDYPTVTITRRPLDDGAEYFGPYSNPLALEKHSHMQSAARLTKNAQICFTT